MARLKNTRTGIVVTVGDDQATVLKGGGMYVDHKSAAPAPKAESPAKAPEKDPEPKAEDKKEPAKTTRGRK